MHMHMTKSTKIIAGGVALTVIGSGAAYAYWTAGGSGTGTAATDTTVALKVNQVKVVAPMYPGDTAQVLNGTFDNPNPGPIYVGTVTASIASVTPVGSLVCDATNFTLANAAMPVNAEVLAGVSKGAWSGATIKFNNKVDDAGTPSVNEGDQNGCKGATVNLSYTIS